MRVTDTLFYTNATNNYQNNMQELFKVSAQISSGLKIQNSFEDSGVFVDAMRLNYEIAALEQVKESSSKAQTYANNTDKVLNQFTDALDRFKTKLIQASSQSNSSSSLNALANELTSLRDHMISLGNTSINGQYLFAGTAFETKPLDAYGNYRGNDGSIEAVIGAGVKLPYNINGADLFLGTNSAQHRTLSTNVKMLNQTELHPSVMTQSEGLSREIYLKESSTIRDMVGDSDSDASNDPNTVFYISGRKSDGKTFSSMVEISSSSKVSDLLEKIGQEYGNTSTNSVVDVTINAHGQIEIQDLKSGNGLLEMHIFGAIDRDALAGTAGDANQSDIDRLLSFSNVDIVEFNKSDFLNQNSTTTISSREDIYSAGVFKVGYPMSMSDGSYVETATLLSDFMPSNVEHILIGVTPFLIASQDMQAFMSAIETEYGLVAGSARLEDGQIITGDPTGVLDAVLIARDSANNPVVGFTTPDSMNYERRGFQKDGNQLSSNISQMVIDTNDFATNRTKLSDVAGVSLSAKQFIMSGLDRLGNTFNAQIDFANPAQVTFSPDGGTTNYTIFNAVGGNTAVSDMTYRQLGDVVAMIVSGHIPLTNTLSDYQSAVNDSKNIAEVGLDYKGRLEIHDKLKSKSLIEFSMFDANADNSTVASALSFMANDLVKIEDPRVDFFKDIDKMIESVRAGIFRMDADSNDPRNIGIQNSLDRVDDIMENVLNNHTKIGSFSNALMHANERSQLLSINIQTIRSEVINVDIGEAYMRFNQLSNSYQAMLSTVAKINSMSLLNYM